MVKDTFKITQLGNRVLVQVDQNTINSIKNFDSKLRKILRAHASLSKQMSSVQKHARIESYMVDGSFDSDVCYQFRSTNSIEDIQNDINKLF